MRERRSRTGLKPSVAARARYGRRAALGTRQLVRRRCRAITFRLLRGVSKALRTLRRPPAPTHLQVVPAPQDAVELADLCARVNWYLGGSAPPIALDGGPPDPEAAPWMDPSLVVQPNIATGAGNGPSHVLLHRVTPWTVLRLLPRMGSTSLVDPRLFYLSDVWGYLTLDERLRAGDGRVTTTAGGEAGHRLLARGVEGGSVLVLGTGPSATAVPEDALASDVRILCNSAVRSRELIRAARPQVIAFGDPVFHFGPSRYAAAFRQDLLWAAEETDALFVVPAYQASLLVRHHPSLAERIVPVEVRNDHPWGWPSAENMVVRATGNVLTELMLPIAFALGSHVRVGGCDGRSTDERYFWRHGTEVQYGGDLMESVFVAHPGFFRDRDYRDYYSQHCAELEELLAVGEARGRSATAVTPSFIPALRARGAEPPTTGGAA